MTFLSKFFVWMGWAAEPIPIAAEPLIEQPPPPIPVQPFSIPDPTLTYGIDETYQPYNTEPDMFTDHEFEEMLAKATVVSPEPLAEPPPSIDLWMGLNKPAPMDSVVVPEDVYVNAVVKELFKEDAKTKKVTASRKKDPLISATVKVLSVPKKKKPLTAITTEVVKKKKKTVKKAKKK